VIGSGTRSANPSVTLININTASLEQLDTLPEIGPITAQNIIDYRNANGLFKRIEDIQDVPEIGQVTFDKIKDLITVGTSP
jgi:competence protein ComEA